MVRDGPEPDRRSTSTRVSREAAGEGDMNKVVDRIAAARRFLKRSDGQGLAEYALILALIAIVAIIALIFLGGQVSTILSTVGNSV